MTQKDEPEITVAAREHDVGDIIADKYELLSLLGEGGVGKVFRARNVGLDREIAVKVLRSQYAEHAGLRDRVLREARLASRVRHPHVVDVLDVGVTAHGVPYIVQELLEGEDLCRYLARKGGKLAPKFTVELLLPIVEALGYAHERGVVHRDIKPENVFLAKDEGAIVPKMLDFGISKSVDTSTIPRVTEVGTVMGTPGYMSPEQITASDEIGAPTDVWALGVLLFECLSGRSPFRATATSALFVEICNRDCLELLDIAPEISETLANVVHKCLQRPPSDRYPNAGELAVALRTWLGGKHSTGSNRRHRIEQLSGDFDLSQLTEQASSRPLVEPTTPADKVLNRSSLAEPAATIVRPPDPPAPLGGTAPTVPEVVATPIERPRPKPIWAFVAVGVGVLASVGAIGVLRPGRATTTATAPPAPTVRADAMTTAQRITIELRSATPDARATIRGRPYPLPATVQVDPNSVPEAVEVSAPGHQTRSIWLTLDRDTSQSVALEPAPIAQANPNGADSAPRELEATTRRATARPVSTRPQTNSTDSGALASAAPPNGSPTQATTPQPTNTTAPANTGPTANAANTTQPNPQPANTAGTSSPSPAGAAMLTNAAFARVAATHEDALAQCADRARSEDPTLSGRLVFRVIVAPTGRVQSVSLARGNSPVPSLVPCLARSIQSWQFPSFAGPSSFDGLYPIVLD